MEMSAIATLAGLALATTAAAIFVVMTMVDGQLSTTNSTNRRLSGNQNNGPLIDPNGPNVQFVLFTRMSGFNTSQSTKIIIHGFTSSIKEEVFVMLKDAYLDTADLNVIGMDWSVLCEFEYLSAMHGVREAGRYLGEFIKWIKYLGVSLEDIHLVGHSMGAHVAGVAGGRIKDGKVGRITGLDPARPGYRDNRMDNKLDAGDAIIVEGLHTFIQVLGLAETVGHFDFYPNGGIVQPGCPELFNMWKIGESLVCNHIRAYQLFAESIRDQNAFKSFKCDSLIDAAQSNCTEITEVYMGQPETYSENGIYFFKTRDKSPYNI